eukprot:c11864_g1_i1.p1 GENE.c11864_g1_i1~~c11864_g1_i1.p1  ORF type:complete len:353 (-),score=113.52 c11864_g1_i1:895-1893(-)
MPKLGVRLCVLQSLLNQVQLKTSGGQQADLTSQQVCDVIIKPATESAQVSYADWLLLQDANREDVGTSTVFVSHVWRYSFATVVQMLEEHCASRQGEEAKLYFWFDIVVVNQHVSVMAARTVEWWSSTFKQSIEDIGNTLVLLTSFDEPVYVTRGWCLWELYCSVLAGNHKVRLDIQLPSAQRAAFVQKLTHDFSSIMKSLCSVDVSQAKTFKEEEQKMILEAVRSSIGFDGMNGVVMKRLREWFADTAIAEISKSQWANVENEDMSLLLNQVAMLLQDHGKFDQAESLFKRALAINEKILGTDHSSTATACNNFAVLLHDEVLCGTCASIH